ncbi:MAG TPA: hypothetical protein VNI78_11995 [Vicinamibacterales bacterium]|nr:hypothetical protein [Vicinamibacterales bacterium]
MRSSAILRAERGLSLIEAAIVLMVIATLAAVVAPSIGGYVRDSQESSAKKDVETIAAALGRMLADVGEAWFVRNAARTGTATDHGSPSHAAANRVDLMVGGGSIPAMAVAPRASGTDWDDAVDHAAVQLIDNYLVLNTPSGVAANAYRSGTGTTGTGNVDPDSGGGFNAEFGWRGAYLPGPIGPDPWGNRYMANVEFLARTQGVVGSGSTRDVIVLSAGGNRQTETPFEADGVSPGGDDLVALVSGSTR